MKSINNRLLKTTASFSRSIAGVPNGKKDRALESHVKNRPTSGIEIFANPDGNCPGSLLLILLA